MLRKISELSKQIRGVSYKPSDIHANLNDSSITLLRANNISDGTINFDDVVYVDKSKVSDSQILRKGDILICASSGSKNLVGKAASVDFDGNYTFGAFLKVVRPNSEYSSYLGQFFQSPKYRKAISSLALGANINNIRNEHIDSLTVPEFDGKKREGIVARLLLISDVIRKRKFQMRALDDLVKARFVEMFGNAVVNDKGWLTEPISKVAPANSPRIKIDEKVWLLNLDMVESQSGKVLGKLIVSEDKINASTCAFDENNVLYSKLRPYLNKVVLPDQEGYCTTELVPLKPSDKLTREFLATLLRSDAFVNYINEKTAGAKMPRVSMNIFRQFECIVPPIALQKQFSKFYKQVDKSKFALSNELAVCNFYIRLIHDRVMHGRINL